MLIHFDMPECLVDAIKDDVQRLGGKGGWQYLRGCGMAISFVRMAAYALQTPMHINQRVVEYHAYTGISAARSAIDAMANWLNIQNRGQQAEPSARVDLNKAKYRNEVTERWPTLAHRFEELGELAANIDRYRQRVQHRSGVPLQYQVYHDDGKWCLAGQDRKKGECCVRLLREWADVIECNICEITHLIRCTTSL
jgi:hypothetical protein